MNCSVESVVFVNDSCFLQNQGADCSCVVSYLGLQRTRRLSENIQFSILVCCFEFGPKGVVSCLLSIQLPAMRELSMLLLKIGLCARENFQSCLLKLQT